MSDLILVWSETVLDLAELLSDLREPAYIVGGAVRDAVLRRPIKDVDIATAGSGIALAKKIANRLKGDFYALDTGRDVGRALVDTPEGRLIFDVAGFRGADLEADLRDRDFTINALAVHLTGDLQKVIDPIGGIPDLLNRVLRRCGPTSVWDDPIRVLRAVRQSVQLGFRIEPETIADLRSNAPRLMETSPERVRDELMRMLTLPKPVSALRVADAVGALGVALPELIPLHNLKQSPPHVADAWNHTLAVVDNLYEMLGTMSPTRGDEATSQFSMGMIAVAFGRFRARLEEHFAKVWPDERSHRALLLLAALLHDVGKGAVMPASQGARTVYPQHEQASATIAETKLSDLHFSSAERDRVTLVVRNHSSAEVWTPELTPVLMHRYWRRLGPAGVDVIFVTLADYLGKVGPKIDQDRWLQALENTKLLLSAYFEEYERYVEPPTLINGSELMKQLNLKPSSLVGDLLQIIREGQVTGDVESVEDALRVARARLNHNG